MPPPALPALAPMLQKLQRRSTFTSQECDALLELPFRLMHMEAGAYLLREGDIPKNCCVLLSGMAYRHKLAKDGSRQILSIHFAGDLLGLDQGLLELADHNVQSLSRVDVGFTPYQAILDLGLAFPNIARALSRATFVDASISREWIVNVGRRNARQRIAHLICELVVLQDDGGSGKSRRIEWLLTQEQLGDATGLTPVHVNRTLQELRAAGLIRSDRHALTILDWTALQDVGGFTRSYLHLPMARAA